MPDAGSRRREQRGWYFYDWANSAFTTSVVTLFFGPYLTSLAKTAAGSRGVVTLAGARILPQAVWPYLVSLSVLTQVIAFPFLGAIADYGRRKKEMLAAFAYTGAAATILMFWLEGDAWLAACVLFLLANFSFGASIVIYNSFLPEIAAPEERDAVSSHGWGMGYAGGGLLLLMNVLLYSKAAAFGISEGLAVRLSLASAGIWWALFTVAPLVTLKNRSPRTVESDRGYLRSALGQLRHTLRQVQGHKQALLFLVAYLLYSDGIQTVITLAAQFGSEELGLPVAVLTTSILISQLVGFLGAIASKYAALIIGNKRAVMASLVIWSAILVYVYRGVRGETDFYVLSAIVGAVMGGSQALSRSIYSFLIPKGREAEYYSLYEISDKGTSWLGPLLFALALEFTGRYRLAVLSLIVFFVAGLLLLSLVDMKKGAQEAAGVLPVRQREG